MGYGDEWDWGERGYCSGGGTIDLDRCVITRETIVVGGSEEEKRQEQIKKINRKLRGRYEVLGDDTSAQRWSKE